MPSSPVSPRDLGLKEKKFQSIEEIETALNVMVRRLNDVYKYNRRDHDRLTEDVTDASGSAMVCTAYLSDFQIVASGGLDKQVELDATLVNVGSKFDAGNNRITITDAGNYLVSARICTSAGNANSLFFLRVKDSGGTVRAMGFENRVHSDAEGVPIFVCMSISMSASSWLALYFKHVVGVPFNIRGHNDDANHKYPTFLSVIKI